MKRISIYCLLIFCVLLTASAQQTKQLVILHTSDTNQESNNTIQSPNLQHFNIFGKIPEPLNQPYAKFTNFR